MRRQDLDPVITEYANGVAGQFMGTKILPVLKTPKKDGTIYILPVGNVTLSTGNLKRSPKSGYVRIESGTGKATFACEAFGLEEPMDNDILADIQDKFGNEIDAAQFLLLYVMRAQEKRVADMVMNVANIDNGAVGTVWTGAGKAYTDVLDGIETLKAQLGGVIGNGRICLSGAKSAFNVLINNAEIKTKQGRGAGTVKNQLKMTAEELAIILGIDEVNFSSAKHAASKDGVMTDIWDKTKMLLHVSYDGMQTRSTPHFGRTMQWTHRSPDMYNVDIYKDEKLDGEVCRVRHNVDEIVHTPKAGYIFTSIQAG